jgi:hypothetical protein
LTSAHHDRFGFARSRRNDPGGITYPSGRHASHTPRRQMAVMMIMQCSSYWRIHSIPFHRPPLDLTFQIHPSAVFLG